jgi:Flp pilus assembly pilin Flp
MQRFWRGENGQDLVEYALLITLMLFGTAALMTRSGSSISSVWTAANVTLQSTANTVTTPPPTGGGDGHHDGGDGN